MTVIYVDTLFLLNAVVDYLLLLCAARLAGEPLHRIRFGIGAVLGGLYAVALFLPGLPSPGYDDLANLAGRLAEILPQLGSPAVVVTGEDMAKALGQALATRLPGPLLCLDGLELPDGSFLDVAAPVAGGAAYPVVKKTLVLA